MADAEDIEKMSKVSRGFKIKLKGAHAYFMSEPFIGDDKRILIKKKNT